MSEFSERGRRGRHRHHPRGHRPECQPQVLLRRRGHQEVPRGRCHREYGDDQGQPGRVPADGGRAAGVHRVHRRPCAGRWPRGRPGVRHPPRRGRLPTRWVCPRSRSGCFRATAAPSGSPGSSDRAARSSCCSPAAPTVSTRHTRWGCWQPSTTRTSARGAGARVHHARLAGGAGLAIAAIKRCVREGGELALANGLALEAELMEQLFKSKDTDEGLHAFVEKRKAEFVGA